MGRSILHLYKPTAGEIIFKGRHIKTKRDIMNFHTKSALVFQDPYSSLNPRMTVSDIIGEPLDVHKMYSNKRERYKKILKLMDVVGLNSEHATRYAHEFSGGQRQRIGIARALALNPEFIVCDEPVSALDVSIQSQIINLFKKLQDGYNLTYLFISHNIAVLKYLCDEIGVMYLGEIVEFAPTERLFANAQHPYTKALLSVIPEPNPAGERAKETGQELKGEIPSPINPPPGCAFSTRCPYVFDRCKVEAPQTTTYDQQHRVACHLIAQD